MTDPKPDNGNTKAPPVELTPALTHKPDAKTAPAPKSGRGVAWLALLVGLGAAGGSGYLWYLWQQDQATQANRLQQAIKQAIAQQGSELQALKTQLKDLAALQTGLERVRADNQALKEQLLGLSGDLQPLKNAIELAKGESDVIQGEIKLVREGQDTHKATVQQQKEELDKLIQAQQDHLAKLDEHVQNMKLSQAGMVENLETVKTVAAKGGDVNAFPLAEVDYLLRLADSKLKLERNVASARLALDVAQQRLKAVNESGLASVQTMLTEAIASLRGVQLPDISALAHKLTELEKDTGVLPLRIASGVPDIKNRVKPSANVTLSTDTERSWWDRSTEAVWNQFKDIVVIRRVRSEAPPLIAMEEEFFLRQNLRLELESMRMALLRGDAQTYQDSAELVRKWTETYFDNQDPRVTAFLSQLQALQAIQLNPYVPDLTGLNLAFRDALNHRQPIRSVLNTPTAEQKPATAGEAQP